MEKRTQVLAATFLGLSAMFVIQISALTTESTRLYSAALYGPKISPRPIESQLHKAADRKARKEKKQRVEKTGRDALRAKAEQYRHRNRK